MTKIYTAVGKFMHPSDVHWNMRPTISIGGKECLLDPQELIIWSCLNWRFAKLEEIGSYYEKEAAASGYTSERSWEKCLDRLMTRGLVVCGCGETDYDALYDLLVPLYILPINSSITARVFTYLKLTFVHRVPSTEVKPLLRRDKKTKKERYFMRLVRQAMLSVGELIRCVDKGVRALDGEDSVMDAVYDNAEITSDNIGATVKYALCCQDVLITVANLYLRQQLIFDRA